VTPSRRPGRWIEPLTVRRPGPGVSTALPSRIMDADGWLADTRTSYDTVAASYADQLRDALAGLPYVGAAVALFAEMVHTAGGGPVADVGCGPGHVTGHLHELGVDAFGIDHARARSTRRCAAAPVRRGSIGSGGCPPRAHVQLWRRRSSSARSRGRVSDAGRSGLTCARGARTRGVQARGQ
jgi:hypothetical protein